MRQRIAPAFRRRIPCPACNSQRTVAYCTRGYIQYRLCRSCGRRFKSAALDLSILARTTA